MGSAPRPDASGAGKMSKLPRGRVRGRNKQVTAPSPIGRAKNQRIAGAQRVPFCFEPNRSCVPLMLMVPEHSKPPKIPQEPVIVTRKSLR
jgi:hypothetical protein